MVGSFDSRGHTAFVIDRRLCTENGFKYEVDGEIPYLQRRSGGPKVLCRLYNHVPSVTIGLENGPPQIALGNRVTAPVGEPKETEQEKEVSDADLGELLVEVENQLEVASAPSPIVPDPHRAKARK